MRFEIETRTSRGGRSYNEDAYGYYPSDTGWCCVVSDGAGGHRGGETASKTAVSTIIRGFALSPRIDIGTVQSLIGDANEAILNGQRSDAALAAMRATAAVICIDPRSGVACWGNVGDTRIYLFRDSRMVYRSRDHSLVQNLVDAGVLDSKAMRSHPKRSVLTSALGADPLEINLCKRPFQLKPGDAFVLCSDGFWEYTDEERMETEMAASRGPGAWLDVLEKELAARAKPDHDNYTAIAAWVLNDVVDDPEATNVLP